MRMKKEAMSALLGVMLGMGVGGRFVLKREVKEQADLKELSDKHCTLMLLFNQWLKMKQEGKEIVEYLHKNRIKTIAIYGMSYVGQRLYDELKGTDIEIAYAIDKNADNIYAEIDILSPDEELPPTDAVIVTSVFYYDEIKCKLQNKMKSRIFSLEDILYEL